MTFEDYAIDTCLQQKVPEKQSSWSAAHDSDLGGLHIVGLADWSFFGAGLEDVVC